MEITAFCGLKALFLERNTAFMAKAKSHAQTDILFLAMHGIGTQPRIRVKRAVEDERAKSFLYM